MTRVRPAKIAAMSITGVVVLSSAAVGVALPAGAAAAGCSVNYAVSSQWPGGFNADVSITNLGDPLSSWTLTWSWSAGQRVTHAWNTTLTQTGADVTARNASYNGPIGTNASVSFGFNGSWNGSNPAPSGFALNGVACTGAPVTSPPSTPPSSPPTSPPVTPPTSPPVTPPATCALPSTYRWTS
ncbi:cellulose-binding domain-containing protein, partial [Actinophytocola sp.]|uniref:cellulose-binding domain-containing protein n=1 Tax=Actinophytocola sp. TaxID=1872138 RepID=UPI002D7F511B